MTHTTFIYALCEPGTRTIRYIGKANDPEKRLRQHLTDSRKLKTNLGNWLREIERPELMLLKIIPVSEWEKWEQSYIQIAKDLGFDLVNSTPGGYGVTEHTEEARQKMSDAQVGRKVTEETRKKLSASGKGRKITAEQIRKIIIANKSRKIIWETRQKMSAAKIGRKMLNSTSSFMGVSWNTSRSLWTAKVEISGHLFDLGRYQSEIEAAQAYDWVAALFGRPLNFPLTLTP